MEDSILECDVLVVGAGMAGLTAAGRLADAGARVVAVERGPRIGGSAALSGGFLWTATSPGRMRLYGGGRDDLGAVVLDNYVEGFAWMRRRGVTIGRAVPVLHGRGYQIDMAGYQKGCAMLVEQRGGHVVCDTEVETLLTVDGRVVGARTAGSDGPIDVRAAVTILATGGFQNDPELRARMIHPQARDRILMRSNPHSRGDGLRLATAVGAAITPGERGFYGHLVSESPRWGESSLFTTLTQYHSEHGLLFNEAGLRFCDETLGDHVSTCATLAAPNARALLFWDARIHELHATAPVVKGTEVMDKMTVALEHGGRGVVADTLEQVRDFATAQGFDGATLLASLAAYNEACRDGWERLEPRRAEHFGALDRPPYYALVVLPAITHTHGGIVIDARCRALRTDGTVIAGLLVAGTDAGDIYGRGYAGGLALALGTGIEAARTALEALR
jgi:succinate dehydrogenase/fumarate reductase flavoprotein subunit